MFRTNDYDSFEYFFNLILREVKQGFSGHKVEIIICLRLRHAPDIPAQNSLLTKFLYRWGEGAKCVVMVQHLSSITEFTQMDLYKKSLFKTFSPNETPLIGATEYSRFVLLKELCRKQKGIPNIAEVVVKYNEERQLIKLLNSVKNLECGTDISLQYSFYKVSNFDLSRLDGVISSIADSIENHPARLNKIIVSICGRNCVCPQNEPDPIKLSREIARMKRQNVSVELEACGRWLQSSGDLLKTVGITGLTYKPNYELTELQKSVAQISQIDSLDFDASRIAQYYTSWINGRNIYVDSSFQNNGLPYEETCRLWKSYWNQLFNVATMHGFSMIAPLTSLYRLDFDREVTAKNPNHTINNEFSAANVGKCSYLPKFGNEAFQFDKNLTGVTFHYKVNLFSTTKTENLALLFEFINQLFERIEVVIEEKLSSEVGIKSINFIIESVEYLRSRAITSTKAHECQFYFNLKNQTLTPEDTNILQNKVVGKVSGAHINLNPVADKTDEKQKALNLLKKSVDEVGIVIEYEQATLLAENEFENELMPSCNYVIIDVNIANVISSEYGVLPKQVIRDFGGGKLNPGVFHNIFLNLRVFKLSLSEIYPKVKVYSRFAWPTTNHGLSTESFLSVWKFIHAFSTNYEFPIFVYQAFDDLGQSDLAYGWWKVQDSNKNVTDLDNYVEKQADYFGLETKRPQQAINRGHSEEPPSTFWTLTNSIIVGMAITGAVLLGLSAAGFVRIRLLKRIKILTDQEKQEFEMGVVSTGENNYDDNHIYGVRYDKDQYELRRRDFVNESGTEIGKGQFGVVYKYHMPRFNNIVAVKLPNTKEKTQLMSILREIKLMVYLGEHTNIVKFLGAYTAEIQSGYAFVVTEYLENGSLLEHLRELKETVDEFSQELLRKLCGFCEDISKGMGYLAAKNVVHGDLAARNVLLDRNYVCKITDFGLSKQLYSYAIYVQTTSKPLPWAWLAVETLEQRVFTTKSDVWSMGVTFWEIFTLGKQPYAGLRCDVEFTRKLREGLRLPKPEFISDEMYGYEEILKCWTTEPEERPLPGFLASFFERQKHDAFYCDI